MSTEVEPLRPDARDIRPLVASKATSRGVALFAGTAAVAAGLLFYTLESRRVSGSVADTALPVALSDNLISSPPALSIPALRDAYAEDPVYSTATEVGFERSRTTEGVMERRPAATPRAAESNSGFNSPHWSPDRSAYGPVTGSSGVVNPPVIFDASGIRSEIAKTGSAAGTDERVTATWFENPSTTIPKGTVIQAVLESALDSTRAGYARAIVSRDVRGFDGAQVLIPRGSRLVGEYKADLTSGQNRALIQWQRLMRPDGAMIKLDSPSADPLGRAGVKGKVDSHFLERFGGTILQSTLDVGVQLATRSVSNDAVILALPGSVQGGTAIVPEKVQPTLKVRQGTSVSVFVSRDLDFSTVAE